MNPNPRTVTIILSLVVLVIGISLAPSAAALYYQVRGGQLVDQTLFTVNQGSIGPIACDFPISLNNQVRTQLVEAKNYLQKATGYDPNASHPYLLLGRANCLLQDHGSAIQSYRMYTESRPRNPLGHLELAFALEAECRAKQTRGRVSGVICEDPELQAQIIDEWKKANIVVGQFISEANMAFTRQDYPAAARWYRRGDLFGRSVPESDLFKWSVASVVTDHVLPASERNPIVIYPLTGNTQIEAEEFQWLREDQYWKVNIGDYLKDHPSADPTVGVMWWTGAAVAFIEVPEKAIYEITVRARDTSPGPMKLQVERDFIPIDQFVLDKTDNNWNELTTATMLSPGFHMIGIRFLEDNGDLQLDWLRLVSK